MLDVKGFEVAGAYSSVLAYNPTNLEVERR